MRTWFRGLPVGSIRSYDELENAFLRQWGEKKDHLYYLTEFGALRKKTSESVLEFTQRFNKLYNKIPAEVKPSQPAAKVTFAGAFDSDFTLLLRERRSTTLSGMQDDAIEIESNIMASGKLKTKVEMGTREPRRFKEQVGPSGSGKLAEEKMDEMAKIIKDLSSKISRMELDQAKPDPYVRNQFRRNPNPEIQQRQVKSKDQKIQAPFKTENFMQRDEMQDYEELEEDLNNLSDDDLEPHLTRQDYEKSLDVESLFNNEENINNVGDSMYQGLADSIMAELQHKYDLRPREKNSTNVPSKKILSRSKENEATVAKPSTETQVARTKLVETRTMQTNKPKNTEAEVQTNETKKTIGGFNLENELNKIKIPMPLVELAKNPIYKKQIAKAIIFSDAECHADVINLQDERPTIMFGAHIENNKDSVAPFYITLTVHDHLLHNCMLDSGASHNLMPKIIMEKLGLEITRPYQDLYSFDSRKVKCLGMIKDLFVNLAQILVKSILMDVVVADVPAKYGMLLSRSWGAKLVGSV